MTKARFDTERFCEAVILIYLIYEASDYFIYRLLPQLTYSGISQYIAIIMAGLVFSTVILRLRQLPLKYAAVFALMLIAVGCSALDPKLLPYIRSFILSDSSIKDVYVFPLAFICADPEKRLRQVRIASYIGLIGNSAAMLTGLVGATNYMNFGYATIIWWAFAAQSIFINEHPLSRSADIAVTAISGLVLAVYANRAALLIMAAVLVACLLRYSKPLVKGSLLGAGAAALIAFVIFFDRIIDKVAGLTESIGISSRNLHLLSVGAFTSVSHRFGIYRNCIELICRHPLWGYGISGEREINTIRGYYLSGTTTGAFAHNILLELCVDYGVIIGGALFAATIIMGVRMLGKGTSREWSSLFLPLYITSMMELLFSSSVYIVGPFWAAVMVYFVCQKANPRSDSRKLRFA